MNDLHKFLNNLHPLLLSSLASGLTIAQIILAFIFHGETTTTLQWIGWACIWLSAIFGVWPIIEFRRKGGVAKGDSYMKTTVLVDTGIYAIVRHPQGGTAWHLINLGVMLLAWHWTSLVLGLISMLLAYADLFIVDQECIKKFGDAYKVYMNKVPKVNFLLGIARYLHQKKG